MDDLISRQAAIDAVYERIRQIGYENDPHALSIRQAIRDLPSAQPEYKEQDVRDSFNSGYACGMEAAQPEPISDAYVKAVWMWLTGYQIKAAELKGRYTPYEVLSWVASDWRKEHERSDQQASDD